MVFLLLLWAVSQVCTCMVISPSKLSTHCASVCTTEGRCRLNAFQEFNIRVKFCWWQVRDLSLQVSKGKWDTTAWGNGPSDGASGEYTPGEDSTIDEEKAIRKVRPVESASDARSERKFRASLRFLF